MGVKETVLAHLEAHKGQWFSGEELAGILSVSRSAVWKAVNSLRKAGYSIEAVTNRGYCLPQNTDILSVTGIRSRLGPELADLELLVLPEVESTNDFLRQMPHAPEGTVVIAGSQLAGRGRRGREFFSPPDTGVYFSILLRPRQLGAEDSLLLTTMAAAAMCQALEAMGVEHPGIKWVNDIFVNGKKVCGILTEGALSMETGLLEQAVLGVGINLYPPRNGFPGELEATAGAVFPESGPDFKNRLTAEFLNRFFSLYRAQDSGLEIYRNHSLVIGREVEVLQGEGIRKARVLSMDDRCRLFLRYETGEEALLSWGEIRLRL